MDEIITFDKSLQQRLREYEEIFSQVEKLTYARMMNEWTYYMELTVDPCGWQAVWKIPRLKCERLNIPFPTLVLVYVANVVYYKLEALVTILAVQNEDIHLPGKHYVPLSQLWATKEQDKSVALNLDTTANALDCFRFFSINLLMPWDEDEDETTDWRFAHLLSRLRFYYDLRNGNIPKHMAEHIWGLLNEARRLNGKRAVITAVYEERDSDVEHNVLLTQNMETLAKINVRIIEIQNEITLLENEMSREIILERDDYTKSSKENKETHIWIVLKQGKAEECISFLQAVQTVYSKETLNFVNSLTKILETATPQDIVLLNESNHTIYNQGALLEDLTIKGIGQQCLVKIISEVQDVLFDCIKDSSSIENVVIEAESSQCAIFIRRGKLLLKNCTILGNKSSSTQQGLLVLSGAELIMENCEIKGFFTAIVGNSNSKITLKNCRVCQASTGLKIYDHCHLKMTNISFEDCNMYGMVLETIMDSPDTVEDDNGWLNNIQYIKAEQVKASNIGKKDYVIIKPEKLKPMEDLFVNPDFEATIMEDSSDEEMQVAV